MRKTSAELLQHITNNFFKKRSNKRYYKNKKRISKADTVRSFQQYLNNCHVNPAEIVVPTHLAVIMDGNGRWATKHNMDRKIGHREGAENLKRLTESCSDIGIKYLTVYAFSTENWKRSIEEVTALMSLFVEFFKKYDEELKKEDIRLRFMGNRENLPESVIKTMNEAEAKSKHRKRMQLIIAFNYGGRTELVDAMLQIATLVQENKLSKENIEEKTIKEYLYVPDVPDPDFVIRTSGEFRLSNFLLWQIAYTEFYVTDVLWPDFSQEDLFEAIVSYNKRERRYGGVTS